MIVIDGLSARAFFFDDHIRIFDVVFFSSVGFEPIIQTHLKAIEQLTVSLCKSIVYQSIQ